MNRNLSLRPPEDTSRISLEERNEVDYWCQEFGVTPQRLRELVAHVGVMADNVRRAAAATQRRNGE